MAMSQLINPLERIGFYRFLEIIYCDTSDKMLKWLINWIRGFVRGKTESTIGIFGPVNVGKTTLANRISEDLGMEKMGSVSEIPHETRKVASRNNMNLKVNGSNLTLNLLDTPGISEKIDYRDFIEYGILGDEALERARQSTRGVLESLDQFQKVDAALVMVDSTKDPYDQLNVSIIRNLEARQVPIILVANKIDLEDSHTIKVGEAFPEYPIIEISALTGKNVKVLYSKMVNRFS